MSRFDINNIVQETMDSMKDEYKDKLKNPVIRAGSGLKEKAGEAIEKAKEFAGDNKALTAAGAIGAGLGGAALAKKLRNKRKQS